MSLRPVLILLTLVTLVAVAGCGGTSSGGEGPSAPRTTQESFERLDAMDFGERMTRPGTVLLDVRTPEEYAAGHIDGAVNLSLAAPDFEERVAALDPSTTYAVYCRTGSRSLEAMKIMRETGLEDIYDLEGGITAWQESGEAVVTGE